MASPPKSLKNLAIRGTAWIIFGYGFSQSLRFVGNIILTRLLFPDLFGLMALINTFILGLALFSDVGIGPSIIQNERGDEPDFFNTAWTLQVMRGVGLWLICIVLSWPFASFYDEPALRWLLPITCISSIIAGFNSTALFTANRNLDLGKRTRLELGTQVIGLTVMIIWAWIQPSIWALIVGQLISAFSKMIWSHKLIPNLSNRFAWDQDAITQLFSFGKWIFISTIMTFLASQSDRLILGKLFSLEMLGVYTVAFTVSEIPRQVINKIGNSVIFPLVSKQAHLPRQNLRANILQKRKWLLAGLALVVAIIASFGDLFILLVYDSRYKAAAWMLPILAVGVWPVVLYETLGRSLYGIGKPFYGAFGNFIRFLFIVIAIPVGFAQFGTLGAIIAITLNDIPPYIAVCYGLWREKITGMWQDLQFTLLLIGLIALLLFARLALGIGFPVIEIG